MTILEIEKGIYEPWENNNNFNLNNIYDKLDTLICDKSLFIQVNKIIFFIIIILLVY